jgi:hypothetical protein
MIKTNGPASEAPNDYTKFLLEGKRRDLQAIELERRRLQIPPDEYLSCRRAILEAIRELEQIVGSDPERDWNRETNRHETSGPDTTQKPAVELQEERERSNPYGST